MDGEVRVRVLLQLFEMLRPTWYSPISVGHNGRTAVDSVGQRVVVAAAAAAALVVVVVDDDAGVRTKSSQTTPCQCDRLARNS